MRAKKLRRTAAVGLAALVPAAVWGATFGQVVPLGGQPWDLALDERRGVLYVANFTANRVEVVSLARLVVETSMNVPAQPASVALSPDGRHLVVAHYGNFAAPQGRTNALTVIDLETRGRQTFALGAPPLGVAFGIDGQALVVTTGEFLLFDPATGASRRLATVEELTARSLPAPGGEPPARIVAASLAASGDGRRIYGLTDTFEFGYEVASRRLVILGYSSDPPMGPRAVSVNRDGSRYLAGWALHGSAIWDQAAGVWILAQLPEAKGELEVGSHAMDAERNLVYAHYSRRNEGGRTATSPPLLEVLDGDNLAVRDRIRLPERLAGKSVLSSDGAMMYSISESGILAMPVGELARQPQIRAASEHLLFEANACQQQVMRREVLLYDPSGRGADFELVVREAGVEVTPRAGRAPATVSVRVDPAAFRNRQGTTVVEIELRSQAAVNEPRPIRVLVNVAGPEQRGTIVPVAGKLVDILADPWRDRFFVLRQDTNEVLVFDGASYRQTAALKTGNTPTQMAFTFDRRYLLVGHENSQLVSVFDLETLEADMPVRMPPGHYPRSVAAAAGAILTASRVSGPRHTIDRVDLLSRRAIELPSLGVWENSIDKSTVLVASPNGAAIVGLQKNGYGLLYSAQAGDFTVWRKLAEPGELKGAYAASSYEHYVAGDRLLNASLVTVAQWPAGSGTSSGFAFVDDWGFHTVAAENGSGRIERVAPAAAGAIRPTSLAEAPLTGDDEFPFTRTVAPLYNRRVVVCLTLSGFTVLAWDYDAAVAPPKISRVVNAADFTEPVAPGGLITIFGEDLSPVNQATSQMPLPTALGESCLLVNGAAVPVLFVSPRQVNAQLPYFVDGNVALVLRTPGGTSDSFYLRLRPAAPSVFRSGVAGPLTGLPAVVRASTNQLATPANPVRAGEDIIVYLTGMGRTNPPVEAGMPAPAEPPAAVLIPPEVSLAGVSLPVHYAGLVPGMAGVYQIRAHVPWWTPDGMEQPLRIAQGGAETVVRLRVVK